LIDSSRTARDLYKDSVRRAEYEKPQPSTGKQP